MTNQLVAEDEGLIDIDEFEGLSVRDIANAIVLAEDDSEDQIRAIAAIRQRAPGIGHNRPPLEESLDDELRAARVKVAEFVERAGRVLILSGDAESASKAHLLAQSMHDYEKGLEEQRQARGKPYLAASRLINRFFDEVKRPLQLAREGEDGKGGLRQMLTRFDNEERARADAERLAALEEARRRDEEAAAARRAAEEAAEAGRGTVAAELVAAEKAEAAERAAMRAEAIRPVPIRSHLGQVTRRREITSKITDLGKVVAWLLEQPGYRNNLEQAVRTIIGAYLKSLKVEAVARGVTIPGVEVSVELGAATSRR